MPENKPKPTVSMLKKLLGGALTGAKSFTPAGQMIKAGSDVISRTALNRMAKNLEPYSYSGYVKTPKERIFDAVVLDKVEENRKDTDQYLEKGYGKIPITNYQERIDLLQMLANKKQIHNTIQPSKYRPTKGDIKDEKYVSSKGIEDQIIEDLGLNQQKVKWQKDLVDIVTKASKGQYEKPNITKGGMAQVDDVPGLGTAAYGVGRDKKGMYISYVDKWDLDPTQGKNSIDFGTSGLTSVEGLKNLGNKVFTKVATNIINSSATPQNVYGRIYFNPKTGKPIK